MESAQIITHILIVLFSVGKKRGRGRPPSQIKKLPKPLLSDVEEILNGESYPLELVTTKLGGMKAAFQNYIFEFHFNRNGVKFWKCSHHKNGCTAKIISKDNSMWPYNMEHNHEIEPVLFVATTDIIEEKSSATEAATPHTDKTVQCGTDLKLRLKERFAALGRKLHKN